VASSWLSGCQSHLELGGVGLLCELLRHEVRCCFSIVYFQLSGYGLYQYKHTSGIVRSKKCFGPFLPMLYFLFLNLRTPAYFFCLLFMIFFLSFFVS